VVGKRLPRGLLGSVVCAGAAVLLLFGMAAPAFADDPPAPRAVPQPRVGRAAPSGTSYNELVTYANDSARDLGALHQQARDVTVERVAVSAEIKRLEKLTERPSLVRDRLERQALRLSASKTPVDPTLSPAVREAAAEMRALRTELNERSALLEAESKELAQYLAIVPTTGGWWRSPAHGELTQEFGPTPFWFEPAREYKGVFYPHFHEGIDIAAPMYSPVAAAAPGRVVWVGHLPDGAMVVLIAHVGGLVSLYAHLDDRVAPPRVAAGDQVQGGQIIGAIGLTGMTTGPHLHFVVWRDGELIDPLSLVAR
jgi:murein DD-endopeptidase MepM/ murein hydrolase activator NlpD